MEKVGKRKYVKRDKIVFREGIYYCNEDDGNGTGNCRLGYKNKIRQYVLAHQHDTHYRTAATRQNKKYEKRDKIVLKRGIYYCIEDEGNGTGKCRLGYKNTKRHSVSTHQDQTHYKTEKMQQQKRMQVRKHRAETNLTTYISNRISTNAPLLPILDENSDSDWEDDIPLAIVRDLAGIDAAEEKKYAENHEPYNGNAFVAYIPETPDIGPEATYALRNAELQERKIQQMRESGQFEELDPPEIVIQLGHMTHTSQNHLVCKVTLEDVPYFNAPIFLKNKQQIGKIDEIFGNLKDYCVSIKLNDDVKASSFKEKDEFFIDPANLQPLSRFLPGNEQQEKEDPEKYVFSFYFGTTVATQDVCPWLDGTFTTNGTSKLIQLMNAGQICWRKDFKFSGCTSETNKNNAMIWQHFYKNVNLYKRMAPKRPEKVESVILNGGIGGSRNRKSFFKAVLSKEDKDKAKRIGFQNRSLIPVPSHLLLQDPEDQEWKLHEKKVKGKKGEKK